LPPITSVLVLIYAFSGPEAWFSRASKESFSSEREKPWQTTIEIWKNSLSLDPAQSQNPGMKNAIPI
jgi:hypothetical protein